MSSRWSSEFRMVQYKDDDHREDAPQFIKEDLETFQNFLEFEPTDFGLRIRINPFEHKGHVKMPSF